MWLDQKNESTRMEIRHIFQNGKQKKSINVKFSENIQDFVTELVYIMMLNFSHIINCIEKKLPMNGSKYMPQFLTEEPDQWEESTGPFELDLSRISKLSYYRSQAKWTEMELMRFLAFTNKFQRNLEVLKGKNKWNYYYLMSTYIETRNTNQCRSCSNKLRKRFGKLTEINQYFQKRVPGFDNLMNKLEENLQKFDSKFQEILKIKNISERRFKSLMSIGEIKKQNNLENFSTRSEYQVNEENENFLNKKYGSMPENFFKLFYFNIWEENKMRNSGDLFEEAHSKSLQNWSIKSKHFQLC